MSEQKLASVWNYKPWWCQPWSILLTGVTLIAGSWILFKTLWLTLLVALPVLTWMGFFLIIYPRLVVYNDPLEK
ncbi:DUF6737 family protein [Chroococcidiopsis sp. TS-821]|uniref:DUF6737 family protein n=1 Tax=Chroococcidiopsis sp. TS-821 TaxID=1378066 RepID=UPI000CEE4565|nr:DUF6737 family protein [Chroococcidiopsis sp. TS-821]PPS43145.1 hypothetical protein B1A85_10530 [Chroococcidiopsis sp. TS-821]